jgi:MFS family permease
VRIAGFRAGGLWRHSDFMKLWAGETVSFFGSQVTALALPMTAVLMLNASPSQMGLLNAAGYLPFLLFTLAAGVWVDRTKRRPLLVVSSLGRAMLLGLIPALAWLGMLRMEHLLVVSFLVGIFTVFFHLAYQSYLPALLHPDQLVEGNSKMSVSESVAGLGGPGIGGLLIEVLTAPFALVLDALSFLASAVGLLLIKTDEAKPSGGASLRDVPGEVSAGLRFTFGNAYLRGAAFEAALYNLFWNAAEAVLLIYAARSLGMSAGTVGMIFTVGAVGALVGSAWAQGLARRFGMGRVVLVAMLVACFAPLMLPLAMDAAWAAVIMSASFFLGWFGVAVYNVHVMSLRQAITPDRLRGRMNASYRFITWGTIPVGALMGGILGEQIGLHATLLAGTVGVALAWIPVALSPIPRLRELPAAAADAPASGPRQTEEATVLQAERAKAA